MLAGFMVKDLDYTMKALKEKKERGLELRARKKLNKLLLSEDTE
jgi:hypothetical protein